MFKKILIANRGEIALRVIRTCKEMGIKTVAVYSKADEESLHVRFADEAVCIGPAPSSESYLKIPNIIAAAEITNADAIHPGYGFLSENAKFSKICSEHKIKFIGPSPEMIEKMGDKATAVSTMNLAKVPTIPGSGGAVEKEDEAIKIAAKIGFPVMVKASAGGGGKGMRAVWSKTDFKKSWSSAKQEASAAFGNDDMYIEKLIQEPRHIEIQIIADQFGNVCHLSERDCSIQRRHQKLTEETPSPFMTSKVEHPITEQVIDYDLIKEQIKVASGIKVSGNHYFPKLHSIECRINAEDPDNDFRPSPGKITNLHLPGGHGVRVDTHVYSGYTISPNYDSMIAKIITTDQKREEAINKMRRALDEFVIEGIKTTIPFHRKLMDNKDYINGVYTTKFMEDFES